MYRLLISVAALIVVASQSCAAPTRPAPLWDVDAIRQAPKFEWVKQDKTLSSLLYEGETYQGRPTRIFAYYALPDSFKGKLPAVVLVHGGGGTAYPHWAQMWAKRGYAVIAMDLTGKGPDGARLPDGGPALVPTPGDNTTPLRDMWTYQSVSNVMRAVSLVSAMPEVDSKRIGIVGISWGGFLTCLVSGVDTRLKAAISEYGSSFAGNPDSVLDPPLRGLSEAQRTLWTQTFDPLKYLPKARMPILFISGIKDVAFPADSLRDSYRLVKNRTLCVTVGMEHGYSQAWDPIEPMIYMDSQLQRGIPLPDIRSFTRKGDLTTVLFMSSLPIKAAQLHYTLDTGSWPLRKWESVDATLQRNKATAQIPAGRPITYFLTVTDSRGATSSTEHEIIPR